MANVGYHKAKERQKEYISLSQKLEALTREVDLELSEVVAFRADAPATIRADREQAYAQLFARVKTADLQVSAYHKSSIDIDSNMAKVKEVNKLDSEVLQNDAELDQIKQMVEGTKKRMVLKQSKLDFIPFEQ